MYFELEDIKRRHQVYWDVFNVGSWSLSPDNSMSWNAQRGVIAGLTAAVLNESIVTFHENWRLLGQKFQPPSNFKQVGIYIKEILKMENYNKMLKTRTQYATMIGIFDIGSRLAMFRWVNNGWMRPFGGFEFNFARKIPGSMFVAAVTAPASVPFEVARLTYYADKTFPKELQKGYTSYYNALVRICFEEGPYWFFKNSYPLLMKNFFATFTLFYSYDFLRDKFSWAWRVGQVPFAPCNIFLISLCSFMASVFSYPWGVVSKEMVDLWPKPNGVCQFDNNYRKAATWIYYHEFGNNFFVGFWKNYFWKQFPWMFTTLYIGGKLGLFTYQSVNLWSGAGNNTWEDSFI